MEHDEPILRVQRTLPARPEAVFAAWTDPRWVASWMCPAPLTGGEPSPVAADLDVRVGGRFSITMEHEGTRFTHSGEYLEISPPRRLVFTWIIPLASGVRATRVTVRLRAAEGDETQMDVLHERLPDSDMLTRHRVGWQAIADRLAQHLESRPPLYT